MALTLWIPSVMNLTQNTGQEISIDCPSTWAFELFGSLEVKGLKFMHLTSQFCTCSPLSVKTLSEETITQFWNGHMKYADLTVSSLLLGGELHRFWEIEKLNSNSTLTILVFLDLLTVSPPETLQMIN